MKYDGNSMPMKVLIANRGEIAVRIMRGCREMGLPTVAIYSDCDRLAPHVRYADEAVALEANEPAGSYLHAEKIIAAARRTGADAVHPGYGFLAENAGFAQAVADAGLRFIGPPAGVIALMGGKTAAREAAARAGVPIVPGSGGPLPESATEAELRQAGDAIGYPIFVKAVAGGGGKGMRLVHEPDRLPHAIRGRGRRPRRPSATAPSTWSAASSGGGTSRCSSSRTSTAAWCRSSSASARFRGATRR